MNRNRFLDLAILAVLIVAAYLLANAIGPKVGASSTNVSPVGIGELRRFEFSGEKNLDRGGFLGSSSVASASSLSGGASAKALSAWGARYAAEAVALGADSGASVKALEAWAARYAGEAAALGAGSGASARALAAWAARYEGQAAALGVSSRAYSGTFVSGSIYGGGEWNPDAFYAGGGG